MTERAEKRKLILWTIAMSLGSLVLLWLLYLLRNVLLAAYVSVLLAVGFSPAVRWIERQHFVAAKRVLPRWAAILVLYVGFLVAVGILLLNHARKKWCPQPHSLSYARNCDGLHCGRLQRPECRGLAPHSLFREPTV